MGDAAVLGIPRPTFDVDLAITISRDRLPELHAELEGFGVPEAYRGGWVDEVAGMPLVKFKMYVGDRGTDADIFLTETRYQQEIMRRRTNAELWGFRSRSRLRKISSL